ncbi:MAG: hypothetical protein HYY29_03575 [Chloroflexi bacterium]|nr:hypothetical protein [Chloroflexota bacterium]
MLKAIETVYKGYRMRSRVEAKWGVYFDKMGFLWEYECEGYDLDGKWYLPDFWLPQVNMWAEVKAGPFTAEAKDKCRLLARLGGYPCLMLNGPPAMKSYWAMEPLDGDYPETTDYALSNYRDYPKAEHRFYSSVCLDLNNVQDRSSFWAMFGDMEAAVIAARQARFEINR